MTTKGTSGAPRDAGRRPPGLSVLLAGLVAIALLPPLVMGAIAVRSVVESRQEAAEARLRATARALALAVDREFGGIVAGLSAFATSPALGPDPLRPRDIEALHAQAVRVGRGFNATVAILAPDGAQVLSSFHPLGTPLARAASSVAVERALTTGRPAVGDLVIGSLSGSPVVSVAVPLVGASGADGAGPVAGVAVAAIGADRLRGLLATQAVAEGAFAAATDSRAVLAARSDAMHDRFVGQPVPADNVRRFKGRGSGSYRAVALGGVEHVLGFAAVPGAAGWTVFVGEPAALFDAAWRGPLLALVAGGTVAILLGGFAAALAARRVLVPLRRLSGHARALAAGAASTTAAAIPPAGVAELEALRQGFADAEAAVLASEWALRRLNEDLERRVQEAVAAREDALSKLAHAQRMEALGQLAGGIAHDFNNVLQAVGGGARLIEDAAGDAARVRRIAQMVGQAAGRGASVTRRLLAFSRRGDLRAEPIDAGRLLAGLMEVLAHTLGGGIRLAVEAEAGLPPLLADRGQLETVLVNLATNGRDAMEGQGTITLLAAAAPAGALLRLSVRDDGPGMAPEVLARASEPFFTTKPRGKGTGLGLAMARGFAEQSGGAFAIESGPGRGTTVSLWLPVAAEEAPAAPPGDDAPPARIGHARVLLVDDDAVVREITAEGLRRAGLVVRPVEGAGEALATLDAGEAVDLLVSDLSMPGTDGLALIREAQRRRPGLPAILLTGFVTDAAELAMGGALSGTFSLLRKPVDARALADRAAMLLEPGMTVAGRESSATGLASASCRPVEVPALGPEEGSALSGPLPPGA